ncbi:MAG: TBC domain-containing protein [archaeon]|nr:TBC domain-containing protein [archaeon]
MEKTVSNYSNQLVSLTRFNKIESKPDEMLLNFLNGDLNLYTILKDCVKGKISPGFRSILYRIFLNNLPFNEPDVWIEYMEDSRKNYYSMLNNLLSANEHIIPFINCQENKGSEAYESFRQYFNTYDFDLLSLIKLDVDRTFQDLELFHSLEIKEMQCKILYVYGKNNSDPSYCQGMNEILGTLLYALFPSLNYGKEITKPSQKEKYYEYINSDEHFEADLYALYEELMSRDLKELYTYNDARFRINQNAPFDKYNLSLNVISESEDSELLKRIKRIYYVYLKQCDFEYFKFLVEQIEPNIFLLRWILCMLNREYSLNNAIWLWDCILGYEFVEYTVNEVEIDKSRLTFLDSLCVSMMLSVKDLCLNTEGFILENFMKFPNERKIQEIIIKAIDIVRRLNGNVDLFEDSKLK